MSLIALYFNFTFVVPVLSLILFLVGIGLDFDVYKKCDILLWSSLITVAPIWLGQPISINTGGLPFHFRTFSISPKKRLFVKPL